jgi:FG-GAP repeat
MNFFRPSRSIVAVALLVVLSPAVLAEPSLEWSRRKLDATPAPSLLGTTVSVSGGRVAVGASGAAYVFARVRGGWRQEAWLRSPDRARRQQFGSAAAISGDTVVVGAAGLSDGSPRSGVAYVFVRDPETGTWSHQATLEAPEPASDLFGYAVAVSGDIAVVGAIEVVSLADGPGRAYVYARHETEWTLEAVLEGRKVGTFYSGFGHAVAVSGETVVVGNYIDAAAPNSSGSVSIYVRRRSEWQLQDRVEVPDLGESPFQVFSLGFAVAVDGDTLLAGGVGQEPNGVYVLVRRGDRWTLQAKLTDPDAPQVLNGFGLAVALAGDLAVVGAYAGPPGPRAVGVADVFVRSRQGTWRFASKLRAPEVHASNNFSAAVAVSGHRIAISSGRQGGSALPPGAVYVFEEKP